MVIKLNKQKGGGKYKISDITLAKIVIIIMACTIGVFSAYTTVNIHKYITENDCIPLVYYTFISGFIGLSLMIYTFTILGPDTCIPQIYIAMSLLLITTVPSVGASVSTPILS